MFPAEKIAVGNNLVNKNYSCPTWSLFMKDANFVLNFSNLTLSFSPLSSCMNKILPSRKLNRQTGCYLSIWNKSSQMASLKRLVGHRIYLLTCLSTSMTAHLAEYYLPTSLFLASCRIVCKWQKWICFQKATSNLFSLSNYFSGSILNTMNAIKRALDMSWPNLEFAC